jgi:hypothetical protein
LFGIRGFQVVHVSFYPDERNLEDRVAWFGSDEMCRGKYGELKIEGASGSKPQ